MSAAQAPPEIEIAGRRIGAAYPPYVICELSGNHNGSLDRALRTKALHRALRADPGDVTALRSRFPAAAPDARD